MPNPAIQPSTKLPLSQIRLFEFDRHEAAVGDHTQLAMKSQSSHSSIADVRFDGFFEAAIQSASPILVICASSMQGFDSFNTPKALGFERLITQQIGLASGQRMIQMEVKIRQ